MYQVVISPRAKRNLKLITKRHRQSLAEVIEEIKVNPFIGKPLTREFFGRFSYRVGVYRIIYQINQETKTIYISSAGHRSVIYGEK